MVVSRTLHQRSRAQLWCGFLLWAKGRTVPEKPKPGKTLDWGLTPGKYSLFLGRLSPEKGLNWVPGEALDELLTNVMLFVSPSDMEGLSLACFFASFTAGRDFRSS